MHMHVCMYVCMYVFMYVCMYAYIRSCMSVLFDAPLGTDIHSEPCQRFFKDGLATSFIRILTDEAVTTWKPDIQVCWEALV